MGRERLLKWLSKRIGVGLLVALYLTTEQTEQDSRFARLVDYWQLR